MRLSLLFSIALTLASLVPGPALGQSCGCQVSDRKEATYDALLDLGTDEQAVAEATHLPPDRSSRGPNRGRNAIRGNPMGPICSERD